MSRLTQDTAVNYLNYPYQTITVYGPTFQLCSGSLIKSLSQSYNPRNAVTYRVWAISFSLAATQKIDVSFFSSSYLDVSVQRVCSLLSVTCISARRVAPFGNPRIISCYANPRSLSQLATSFVASKSQGIPHAPLFTFSMIISSLLLNQPITILTP